MPIQYIKGSFKKIGEREIEFKIKNTEGSARVSVSPSIFLDDVDVTSQTSIGTKDGGFMKIEQNMDLNVLLGGSITLRATLEKPIEKGSHMVKVDIKVNWPLWTSFVSEFKIKA